MFSWNIAKSAECVFSQWAMRRLFKFLLKKKLGQFLLGDIDLDQLDMQLRQGTIQLNDLALNVDYLNDKFGDATSVIMKEGSIGSLSVKMPWKGKGFQVEVEELELVFALAPAPCMRKKSPAGDDNCGFNQESKPHINSEGVNSGHGVINNSAKSSFDVHEGVKTIAKMVNWLLTSFHVKVNKLIVAFEPYSGDEKKDGHHKTLVFRVSEAECGTCVSDDAELNSDARFESFLGISQLTNFITFQGAVLELLQMDDVDNTNSSSSLTASGFGELFSGNYSSNARTPIVTGSKGGFSGNLKLSIPWKNGSLDIRKLDADISIDPVELRFQPSTIKWLLFSWETYKTSDKERHSKSTDSVDSNSASHLYLSTCNPAMFASDKVFPVHGGFFSAFTSLAGQESASEVMLPGSHLILDWVPNSVKEKDASQDELDLGKSVDQFFECFDGMRSSQSALGSSGMWNWTCSVFSALTAASGLASGSLHVPLEQQHVQTNLEVTLAGISILLSFHDEDQEYLYYPKGDQSINVSNVHNMAAECDRSRNGFGLNVHRMVAECKNIFVALQVCPQEMRFEGKVKYIEIADYSDNENDVMNLSARKCSSDSNSSTLSIQHLQGKVEDALPPLTSAVADPAYDELSAQSSSDFDLKNMTKIQLLSTSGVTNFQFSIKSGSLDGSLTGATSFSFQLPQFVFWVNFWSISMLLNLLKDIGEYVKTNSQSNGSSHVNQQHGSSLKDVKGGSCAFSAKLSSTENLKGNISLSNARIILCFPFGTGNDTEGGYFFWDQFIAIDFSSPSTLKKENVRDTRSLSDASSWKRCNSKATRSLHLCFGIFKIYLVSPTCKSDTGMNSAMPRPTFCAQKIFSISSDAGCPSTVSLLWKEGSVTGPWIAERAKSLATKEESRRMKKTTTNGCEFASVTSTRDREETNSQIQEEMILSSAFVVHIHLCPVIINLDSFQYGNLHHLLDQMLRGLSGEACDAVNSEGVLPMSQTSILVECGSVEIVIRPEIKEDVKKSLQNELPGSWDCLRLNVEKLDVLSVSNIGGIGGANLFWLAHGEGKLWGSITGVPDQEFLLISCCNSTRKRGDGGGSNVLSSRLAGSDIVHLRDPKNSNEFLAITVKCGTIVAVGGRMDWLDVISSFFSLPSQEEKVGDDKLPMGDMNEPCGTTFFLKLMDIGLSYEPYLKNSVISDLHSVSSSSCFNDETSNPHVACLLAASSFTLLNETAEDTMDNDYKIVLQDLGLLLCAASENLGGIYSVEYLRDLGYVKVAQEALVEAILRTNCKNGLPWELEWSESHIYVETCRDTTTGLILLASQLQQLYAPDIEESVVYLQTRWNNVHQAQVRNGFTDEGRTSYDNSASPNFQAHASSIDTNNKLGIVGLMDEIREDAFHLDRNHDCQFGSNEAQVCISFDEGLPGEACCLSVGMPEKALDDLSFDGSVPPVGQDSCETSYLQKGSFPELIEGYCLSDLRPLSELSMGMQSPSEIVKSHFMNLGDGDLGRGSSGWYEDAPLSIVENHISGAREEASLNHLVEDKLLSLDCARSDDFGKSIGCLLLKNINVTWRMFTGSDWYSHKKSSETSNSIHGRDTTASLELVLSGMQFKYDFFPISGICASKLSLAVQDFYLYDRSKSAPWKRVLGYYRSKDHPRESTSKALKLVLEAVRPDPQIPLEEYRLSIALLPMILQLHQSQLDFLVGFFGAKDSLTDQSSNHNQNSGVTKSSATKNLADHRIAEEALLPYFQKFDIQPIVLRVDYSPRHVDIAALGSGKYVELVNLVPWKGVELRLKNVHAIGVYGWANVCETIVGEWLEDISQNQIHKVLRGVPTIRSLVAVVAGAAKLVSLPVESYKKDQRVLKGVQRGTLAFLRSISLEAVGLGVHLAAGVHDILLQAEYTLLTRIPPASCSVEGKIRCNQPKNAKQGFQQAYESLSDGLGKSASALVQTPLKKYQRGASAGAALATAVQGVPAAAIAPVSACASAVHSAFLGLRNSLDPEHKKESMDKYLGPTQQPDTN